MKVNGLAPKDDIGFQSTPDLVNRENARHRHCGVDLLAVSIHSRFS